MGRGETGAGHLVKDAIFLSASWFQQSFPLLSWDFLTTQLCLLEKRGWPQSCDESSLHGGTLTFLHWFKTNIMQWDEFEWGNTSSTGNEMSSKILLKRLLAGACFKTVGCRFVSMWRWDCLLEQTKHNTFLAHLPWDFTRCNSNFYPLIALS